MKKLKKINAFNAGERRILLFKIDKNGFIM